MVESLWDLTDYLLLKGGCTSPLVGPVTGPGVLIWCWKDILIDGLLAQLVVVYPLLCPVLDTTALPLSLLIVLGQPPPMLVPLLLVLFLLLVCIVVNLATLSGNAMIITDPAVPILHMYTHLQLLLPIHYLFLTGHPFLATSLCPRSLSIRGTPQSLGSNSSFYSHEHSRVCSTDWWPCITYRRQRR